MREITSYDGAASRTQAVADHVTQWLASGSGWGAFLCLVWTGPKRCALACAVRPQMILEVAILDYISRYFGDFSKQEGQQNRYNGC